MPNFESRWGEDLLEAERDKSYSTSHNNYNDVYDPNHHEIDDQPIYASNYFLDYPKQHAFINEPKETYLTTVTPRLQRSFIPLREFETDIVVDASQMDNHMIFNHNQKMYDNQTRQLNVSQTENGQVFCSRSTSRRNLDWSSDWVGNWLEMK